MNPVFVTDTFACRAPTLRSARIGPIDTMSNEVVKKEWSWLFASLLLAMASCAVPWLWSARRPDVYTPLV